MVAASLVVLLTRRSVHSVILNGLEKNVSTVALTAAQSAAPGFESGERTGCCRSSKLSRTGRALYAAALDTRGKVLAHTTIKKKARSRATRSREAACVSDQPVIRVIRGGDAPVLEVAVPVWFKAEPAPVDAFMLSGRSPRRRQDRPRPAESRSAVGPVLESESRVAGPTSC